MKKGKRKKRLGGVEPCHMYTSERKKVKKGIGWFKFIHSLFSAHM